MSSLTTNKNSLEIISETFFFSQNYDDDDAQPKIKEFGKTPANVKRGTSISNDFQSLDIKSGVKSTAKHSGGEKKDKNDKEDDLWDMLNN